VGVVDDFDGRRGFGKSYSAILVRQCEVRLVKLVDTGPLIDEKVIGREYFNSLCAADDSKERTNRCLAKCDFLYNRPAQRKNPGHGDLTVDCIEPKRITTSSNVLQFQDSKGKTIPPNIRSSRHGKIVRPAEKRPSVVRK
jgi:hypothetical protein